MSTITRIGPQGAEEELVKSMWWVVGGMKPNTETSHGSDRAFTQYNPVNYQVLMTKKFTNLTSH